MKKIVPFGVIIICIIIIFFNIFKPVKKSVKLEDLNNTEYILIKKTETTAAAWMIVGDNNGYYKAPIDVTLRGNTPNISYDLQCGDNTYICYGYYEDDITTAAGYLNKVFNVEKWDILYPVDHNMSIFSIIFSKNYLYSIDME